MKSRSPAYLQGVLRALCVGVSTGLLFISSQTFSQDDAEEKSVELDRVSVTGTRIKRVDIEGSTPVTIITREEIDASGDATIAELLRSSTYNTFGSARDQSGQNNGASATAAFSLRGLGAERTLVLLNGRRMAAFPGTGAEFVDINLIPMAMVERVEILRDGASAIYGSDAIAGVVNIITRKDMNGAVLTVQLESPDVPGGEMQRYSVAGGMSSERGNVTFSIEHFERDPVFERDVPHFADITDFSEVTSWGFPGSGMVLGGPQRFLNFVDPRCPSSTGDSDQFPESFRWDFGETWTGSDWGFSARCGYNYAADMILLPRAERNSGYIDARFDVTGTTQFVTRALIVQNEGETRFAAAPLTSPFPVYPADHPYNPLWLFIGQTITDPGLAGLGGTHTFTEDDLAPVLVFMRTIPNGTRDGSQSYNNFSWFAGFEGSNDWLGGTDWDLGFEYDRNLIRATSSHFVNGVEIQNTIDSGKLDFFNVQGLDHETWLANTIETMSRANHTGTYDAATDVITLDGTLSFDLLQTNNGPVPVVVGFEYFDLALEQIIDPESASGAIGGGGDRAFVESAGRDILSIYAETVLPLGQYLELNLAARYDHYSDFGNTTNPKVSIAWRPADNWLLRASYGTGFRAPSMNDMFIPQTEGFVMGLDHVGCANAVAPCRAHTNPVITGGNPDLQPEESRSWTAGLVWNASDDLALELTWYDIEFTNEIGWVSLSQMFERERDGLSHTVVRNPDGTVNHVLLTTLNLAGAETSGIDFTAGYTLNTDKAGLFSFNLEWTHVLKWANELAPGEGPKDWRDYYAFPVDRGSFNLNWTMGDYQASWVTHYVGEHGESENVCFPSFDDGPCDENEELIFLKAAWVHDLQLAWNTPWNAQIAIGARNLFNTEPPYHQCCRGPNGGGNLYDPRGRITYLRYTQNF